jgi:hypothetical protein
VLLHSYFLVSPEMFDRFQVWLGHSTTFKRLVPKPLLRCLVGVFSVIVLLEGELSPQSKVLSALVQVNYILRSVHLSLDPD